MSYSRFAFVSLALFGSFLSASLTSRLTLVIFWRTFVRYFSVSRSATSLGDRSRSAYFAFLWLERRGDLRGDRDLDDFDVDRLQGARREGGEYDKEVFCRYRFALKDEVEGKLYWLFRVRLLLGLCLAGECLAGLLLDGLLRFIEAPSEIRGEL